MAKLKICDDVKKAMERASKVVGNHAAECHDFYVFSEFLNHNIESPIEQILLCAMLTIKEIHYAGGEGYTIVMQKQIDRFRADFEVVYSCPGEAESNPIKSVIVECDSQQFHERTEKERRYEKARDRHFQMKGYKVFRYTGKEIIENPFKIACEIFGYLGSESAEELYSWFKEYK